MSVARRIAKNSVFQVMARGVKTLTAFVVPLYLARMAGAVLLGQYATMITFAELASFFAIYGLPSLLVREIARWREDREQVARLVNASLGLVVVCSTVATLVMVAVAILLGYPSILIQALALVGLALGIESLATVLESTFRGIEEMDRSAAIVAVMDAAFLVLALVVIPFKATIGWLMVAYVASRIASLVVGAWLYQSRLARLRPTVDREAWSSLLKRCFPFAVNNGLSSVYVRIDVVFLSYLSGSAVVGLYEAANNLTMRVNILARTINLSMYPFLSAQFVRDKPLVRTYTAKTIRYLAIPGVLISAILWAFGDDIVLLLYGRKFVAAVSAVKLLGLIIPLRFLDNSLAIALSASNREGKRAVAVGIAAVTNVLLDFVLIPPYHMMGAVYATILTEVVLFAVFVWYLRDEAHEIIDWRAFVGPGLGAATILGASMLLNMVNVWLLGGLSVLLYGLIVGWVDPSSIRLLRLIAARRMP